MLVAVSGLNGIAVLKAKPGSTLNENMRPSVAARHGAVVGYKAHGAAEWQTLLSNGSHIPATEASTRRYESAPMLMGVSDER